MLTDFLVLFVFCFAGFQGGNVLLNLLFRQRLFSTRLNTDEKVSVLIPARDEEKNIEQLLSLLRQIETPFLEIIVCDDHSTDRTREIVTQFASLDNRIRLIESKPLPSGWLGKNHACYQLAQVASGRYFLFVDADVRIYGTIISDAVAYCRKYHLGLLSIFPKQIMLTNGEKRSVPLMNYILLTLLPLIFVRVSPFASHAAANGQFMLFDAEVYRALNPHEKFRNSPVEDISIARHFKRNKIKVGCVTGEKRVECRMYSTYEDAINGFAKNIFMFFGNSPFLAFLFWAIVTLGFIPVLIFSIQWFWLFIIMVLFNLFSYALVSKQNPWESVLLFPTHVWFMLQVMRKAWSNRKNKNYLWKGRNIYLRS